MAGEEADALSETPAAVIARASVTDEDIARARADLAAAQANIKEVGELSAKASESAQQAVEWKSSFDDQWEAFKRKFDEMTSKALQGLAGLLGASMQNDTRPAEVISEERAAQVICRARHLVVLTGAGISSESGIPTFRGADGFWTVGSKNYQPQELATWEKFNEMPEELWRWYQYRWGICRKAKPNAGHKALVDLESLVNGGLTLVTQNVDGLHLEAGTNPARLCEIHGRIDEMRCDERMEGACLHGVDLDDVKNLEKARACIRKAPEPAAEEKDEQLPLCDVCGVRQRPKILWFDESYNEAFYKWKTVAAQAEQCDVLLIVGTQLTTGGPTRMVRMAQEAEAIIIRLDAQVDLEEPSSAGMLHVPGKSGEVLPRIVAFVKALLKEPSPAPLATVPDASGGGASSSSSSSSGTMFRTPVAGGAASTTTAGLRVGAGTSAAAASVRSPSSSAVLDRSAVRRDTGRGALMAAASISLAKARPAPPPAAKAGARVSEVAGRGGTPPPRAAPKARGRSPPAAAASEAPVGFFAHGTLRPDDDSGGLEKAAEFLDGLESAVATLSGASLYVREGLPNLCLEQTRCGVRGALLVPSGRDKAAALAAKLLQADRLMGFPERCRRSVMEVQTAAGERRRAHVYHHTGLFDRADSVCIADGDWLSRKRKQVQKKGIEE